MDLDEFAVGVLDAGLHAAAGGTAGAGHRHRAAAVDQPAAAGGQDDRIGREGADFHRDQVLGDRAAATAVVVDHRAQIVPAFVHFDEPGGVPATDLFVEGVEQLLSGGGAGKRGPFVERAAEAALVAKAFGRAIEGHAEPVHQVDDPGSPVGHFLDGRLMLEEVAAVDGVVEVQLFAVALLASEVVDAVDAALGTDAVRTFHRREAHQVDRNPQLGQFHGGRQTGQSAADD